jgi:hypothetical protein
MAVVGDDVARAIDRAVVDDDDLAARVGLTERAVDRFAQKPVVVVVV